jgi:acetolactate synthase-1/2/3 large subunit
MATPKKVSQARRGFLMTAAGAAALAGVAPDVKAGPPQTPERATPPPSAAQRTAETVTPSLADVQIIEKPGSDFMVDVIRSLGIEYLFANPGSSFRGLHESVINYGGNTKPEFITCMHEDSSVAMANGYAKIEGKPVLVCVHGTVGLQHAAMSVYNAYCDQAPVIIVGGSISDAAERRGRVEWLHSAQDIAAMVRDFTKWDDNPQSLQHFAESFVRGYQLAMTPPMMPIVLTADGVLQESPIENRAELRIPKLGKLNPPAGDMNAVNDLAKMLVAAENPLIIASRSARTPEGLRLLVELAETLQCGVVDQQRRMNFPSRHPLNQTLRTRPAIIDADVILGLEIYDFFGTVHALGGQVKVIPRSLIKPNVKLVSISSSDLFYKSNYQNFQRYQEVDFSIAADAEATLPALIEAVKRLSTADRKQAYQPSRTKTGRLSLILSG